MKQTVSFSEFIYAFRSFDGRYEQLGGREGLRLLLQYLEECETDSGEEWELDVIALCCDYACQSPEDIANAYDIPIEINANWATGYKPDPEADADEYAGAVMDYLLNHTIVVDRLADGRILYQQF